MRTARKAGEQVEARLKESETIDTCLFVHPNYPDCYGKPAVARRVWGRKMADVRLGDESKK